MIDYVRSLWDDFLSFWNQLSNRQQIVVGSITFVAVAVVSGLLYWSSQPQMVVLYNRELETEEASNIATQLEEMGVQYEIDGNVIRVPFTRVDRLRMQLAQEGIQPTSTVGFEIFERGGIGITDFERQMRYKRALEGSLVRSIRTMQSIEDAEIRLALPQEEALFEEDEKPVTASVILSLSPFTDLGEEQIRGIVSLVSYGVVGLNRENVKVMNQQGQVLWDSTMANEGASNRQLQQLKVKRQVEDSLESKIMSSLGQVLTRERIAAAVTVSMNFDQMEKRMTKYRQPEGSFQQLMVSEERTSKSLEGENVEPGGPAGTESNIPGAEEQQGNATDYEEESSVVNYLADEIKTTIVQDPAVSRVSTLLTVDGTYDKSTNDAGETVYEYQPPTQEEMDKIRQLARAAVGFNDERGDQIEVEHIQFDRSDELQERRQEQQQAAFRRRVAYFIAGALALTLIVGGTLYWLRQRQKRKQEEEEVEPEVPERDLMAEVSIEEKEREQLEERIQQAAEEDPETVAQILRTWYSDEMQ
jgi:flagellar M-ring protein FliF